MLKTLWQILYFLFVNTFEEIMDFVYFLNGARKNNCGPNK